MFGLVFVFCCARVQARILLQREKIEIRIYPWFECIVFINECSRKYIDVYLWKISSIHINTLFKFSLIHYSNFVHNTVFERFVNTLFKQNSPFFAKWYTPLNLRKNCSFGAFQNMFPNFEGSFHATWTSTIADRKEIETRVKYSFFENHIYAKFHKNRCAHWDDGWVRFSRKGYFKIGVPDFSREIVTENLSL